MAFDPKTAFGADFAKIFSDLKLPAMPDMGAFMKSNQRNMETLAAANRMALEGAQAVARRQGEIVQQSMSELTDAISSLSGTASPQEKAAKQAELLKHGYERSVANLRELGDLISKSNAEAIEVLNNRFAEAMDEVKALASKS